MANGWTQENYVYTNGRANVLAGIVASRTVSKVFPITSQGARHIVIGLTVSGVNQTGTITGKLQTSIDNGTNWEDSKTTTFTAASTKYIRLNDANADDKAFLPLLALGRVVFSTTHGDDDVTVDAVYVLQSR
jgi:hypothetical protein